MAPVCAYNALSCRAGRFLGERPATAGRDPATAPGWADSERLPRPQAGHDKTAVSIQVPRQAPPRCKDLLLPLPAVQFCFQGSTKHRIRAGLTGDEDVPHHAGTLQEEFSYAGPLPHAVGRGGSRRLHGECFRTSGQALCLLYDGILDYPTENHKSNDASARPQGSSRQHESKRGCAEQQTLFAACWDACRCKPGRSASACPLRQRARPRKSGTASGQA